MDKKGFARSPLFYVGDKYKLLPEITPLFPKDIVRFIEPFVGGGSVFMNVKAQEYLLNDLDSYVISIHQYLCEQLKDPRCFFDRIYRIIDDYGLSCSLRRDDIPASLKTQYVKTYFAKYNKIPYEKMRSDYNKSAERSVEILYILLIYGFNRMLRFNGKGDFNLPVGNVDFNKNTEDALNDYFNLVKEKKIHWQNIDFNAFFRRYRQRAGDFIYLDPPYLITFSEYNKYWNEETEDQLLNILSRLNGQGVRFAISNVTHYKGKINERFLRWSEQFNVHPVKSNYISYHDNTIKSFNEVLVTNY